MRTGPWLSTTTLSYGVGIFLVPVSYTMRQCPTNQSLQHPFLSCPQETLPYGGVAVGGDPDAGEIVRVDSVLNELSAPVLVHVDASCLPVVDLTLHDGRIRARLHLKPCDPVVVDVVRFEVTLETNNKRTTHLQSLYWAISCRLQ